MEIQRRPPEHLIDDGSFHCCTKIGKSYLICGRKSSHFPYTCLVGPDWYCMLVTYAFVTVPTVLFIRNVAVYWGASVIVITVILLFTTLGFFTMTACSDPGIVFVQRHFSQHTGSDEDRDSSGVMLTNRQETASDKAGHCESNEEFRASDDDPNIESDLESAVPLETSTILGRSHSPSNSNAAATSSSLAPGTSATNRISVGQSSLANRNSHNNVAGFALLGAPSSTAASMLPQPMVECGRCQIDRPTIAYHCGYCGVCVRKLDHHCPWTGKCIGEKTINMFYGFLWSLMTLIGFVVIFVIVAMVKGYDIF